MVVDLAMNSSLQVSSKTATYLLAGIIRVDKEFIKSEVGSLRGIEGVKIALLAREDKKWGIITIAIRSVDIPIDKVAKKYQGGGHELAAGGKLDNWDQLDDLINDLEEVIEENEK